MKLEYKYFLAFFIITLMSIRSNYQKNLGGIPIEKKIFVGFIGISIVYLIHKLVQRQK